MADIIFPGDAPLGDLGESRLPQNLDLSIWQGDAQEFFIDLKDSLGVQIELTGCTAQAVLRQSFNAPTAYTFDCTVQPDHRVRVYMPSVTRIVDGETQQGTGDIPPGDYVWNFQITDVQGDVRTYLAGDAKVYAEVD